jgi:hypothetical protein
MGRLAVTCGKVALHQLRSLSLACVCVEPWAIFLNVRLFDGAARLPPFLGVRAQESRVFGFSELSFTNFRSR